MTQRKIETLPEQIATKKEMLSRVGKDKALAAGS